jgi:hypothetical protein
MENVYEKVSVISKKEVEELWGEKTRETRVAYPEKEVEEIIIDEEDSDDYFIIYLSGVSIQKMFFSGKFKSEAKFWYPPKDIEDKGPQGYYLVKTGRQDMEGVIPDEQDLLGMIPKSWRRATTREAMEIILNISLIAKRDVYKEKWHFSKGRSQFKGGKINSLFTLMNFRNKILTVATRPEERIPAKTNSITIMKLL